MKNKRRFNITLLSVLWLACLTGCGKHMKAQSLKLDSNTRVTLKDAWVIDHAPQLLQAVFVYEGTDPNDNYLLAAGLGEMKGGPDMPRSWIKQYPTPSAKSMNQYEVIWEFMNFPKNSSQIYLHLYYSDKQSRQQNSKLEFILPGVSDLPLHKMGQ